MELFSHIFMILVADSWNVSGPKGFWTYMTLGISSSEVAQANSLRNDWPFFVHPSFEPANIFSMFEHIHVNAKKWTWSFPVKLLYLRHHTCSKQIEEEMYSSLKQTYPFTSHSIHHQLTSNTRRRYAFIRYFRGCITHLLVGHQLPQRTDGIYSVCMRYGSHSTQSFVAIWFM